MALIVSVGVHFNLNRTKYQKYGLYTQTNPNSIRAIHSFALVFWGPFFFSLSSFSSSFIRWSRYLFTGIMLQWFIHICHMQNQLRKWKWIDWMLFMSDVLWRIYYTNIFFSLYLSIYENICCCCCHCRRHRCLFVCLFSSGSLLFDFDIARNIIRMEFVVRNKFRTKTFMANGKMILTEIEIKSVTTIVEHNLTFSHRKSAQCSRLKFY